MLGGKSIVEACACVRFLLEPMSVGLAVSTSCKLSLGLCLAVMTSATDLDPMLPLVSVSKWPVPAAHINAVVPVPSATFGVFGVYLKA